MNSRAKAFIGQASESDLRMALNYIDAFEVLYYSNKYQDQIVIPALFLVRQFLELGLKYNISELSKVSGSKSLLKELTNTHDLNKLYNSFIEHYKNAKKMQKLKKLKDTNYLEDLHSLIKLVNKFDNSSMGYRYSKNKGGEKQIDINETYKLEDIKKLLVRITTLFSSIDYIFGLREE